MDLKFGHSLVACLALCASVGQADVTVFAAASLKTALDEVVTEYEAQGDDQVIVSYAGSSALARQIQYGAPADVVILANPDWMDVLEADALIDPKTRVALLGNRMAVIAHGQVAAFAPDQLPEKLGEERLAMALVNAVPAGIYGKAALEYFDLWNDIAPQIAQTDNVRVALALVALGETPFGITYVTDAKADARVSVTAVFPQESHPPIRYPMAMTQEARPASKALIEYMQSPSAAKIFAAHGFIPLVR
jgi:molybdate transport system substrate-binding protein